MQRHSDWEWLCENCGVLRSPELLELPCNMDTHTKWVCTRRLQDSFTE